jgi:hypothetical protein
VLFYCHSLQPETGCFGHVYGHFVSPALRIVTSFFASKNNIKVAVCTMPLKEVPNSRKSASLCSSQTDCLVFLIKGVDQFSYVSCIYIHMYLTERVIESKTPSFSPGKEVHTCIAKIDIPLAVTE